MTTPHAWVGLLPPAFDADYIERAVVPYLSSSEYVSERPALPMIDFSLSKENAAPPHFWGMLYDGWAPDPKEGTTVFITGYDQRGPNNERKKIYASATTPDLYTAKYAPKIHDFLARLFGDANAGKPLMREYYQDYFDLYWDLHLGATGEAIPPEVRAIGAGFTAVLGHWYPTEEMRSRQAGLARCPFPPAPFTVMDGRRTELTNSAFGAVYGVVDDTAYPVCDSAGYAPFGFGYRRCGGEQLTTEFVKEFLRTVWLRRITFTTLDVEDPERIPVSPRTVIDDNIGFRLGS